jgi:NAD(P)-dependent dehydrogenase (short-subunit alcohol dehydrogenase family)
MLASAWRSSPATWRTSPPPRAAIEEEIRRVGTVDVFVNNAGMSKHGLFERVQWCRTSLSPVIRDAVFAQ